MPLKRPTQDPANRNRRLVLGQILHRPGLSRTEISNQLGLNPASVSRISRELIEAGLVEETDAFAPEGRPGRRFVGMAPRGEGGYIIGIGMNAFRQSVTLADLNNRKIAEWINPTPPGPDGHAFLRLCLEKADAMVATHVPDRKRFFGVGIAIAADLDPVNNEILAAPVFGWKDPIDIGRMVQETLDAPLVLDTPSSAITRSEADFGQGMGVTNLVTLHCSLGFGVGVRQQSGNGTSLQQYGRVLTHSKVPDGSGRLLSEVCGGLSLLSATRMSDDLSGRTEVELGQQLTALIDRAGDDPELQALFREKGVLTAQCLSLVFDLCQPECLLLAGPLSASPEYVAGFSETLPTTLAPPDRAPDIQLTDLTPTGASRWIALSGNVVQADLDLEALKQEAVS